MAQVRRNSQNPGATGVTWSTSFDCRRTIVLRISRENVGLDILAAVEDGNKILNCLRDLSFGHSSR